jgi:hypothetical protein
MAYLVNKVVLTDPQSDAFGRGRVAYPQTLFNCSFEYDAQPLLMQALNVGTGSATKTANISSVTISTGGAGATAASTFQSHGYYRYEAGKSQLIFMTGIIGAYKQYVRSQIGYFDALDGVFFDMDGTSQGATGKCAVTVRTSTSGSAVDTAVLSTSWNIDKMDGTGPSGVTLDFTKMQIFVIDLQWLGTGRVRFGFSVNGQLYYCHQILNSNVISVGPYMNSGSRPVAWKIANTSGSVSGSTSITAVCCTVISEGGNQSPAALAFSANNGSTTITAANGTRTPLLSIQPKTTFNSITNRSKITVTEASLSIAGANNVFWELVYNGTLGGSPSFASVNANSGVNVDVAASSCTGGTVVASGYVGSSGSGSGRGALTASLASKLFFGLDIAGTTPDTYTLCATGMGATVATTGEISWTEER